MEGNARQFHDLRHTGCTRMLEAGVPFPVIAELMGWSPETTVRMAKRYGHIGRFVNAFWPLALTWNRHSLG